MEVGIVVVILVVLGILVAKRARRSESRTTVAENPAAVEFVSTRNNSGKTLYRAIINGKIWTSSDPNKLRSLISGSL